jgi:hypothetical protein
MKWRALFREKVLCLSGVYVSFYKKYLEVAFGGAGVYCWHKDCGIIYIGGSSRK